MSCCDLVSDFEYWEEQNRKHKFAFQTEMDLLLIEVQNNYPEHYKTLKQIFKKTKVDAIEELGEDWYYDRDGKAVFNPFERHQPIYKVTYFYPDVRDYFIIHDDPYRQSPPKIFFYLFGKRATKEEEQFWFGFFYFTQLMEENYEGCTKLREQAKTRFPDLDLDALHERVSKLKK